MSHSPSLSGPSTSGSDAGVEVSPAAPLEPMDGSSSLNSDDAMEVSPADDDPLTMEKLHSDLALAHDTEQLVSQYGGVLQDLRLLQAAAPLQNSEAVRAALMQARRQHTERAKAEAAMELEHHRVHKEEVAQSMQHMLSKAHHEAALKLAAVSNQQRLTQHERKEREALEETESAARRLVRTTMLEEELELRSRRRSEPQPKEEPLSAEERGILRSLKQLLREAAESRAQAEHLYGPPRSKPSPSLQAHDSGSPSRWVTPPLQETEPPPPPLRELMAMLGYDDGLSDTAVREPPPPPPRPYYTPQTVNQAPVYASPAPSHQTQYNYPHHHHHHHQHPQQHHHHQQQQQSLRGWPSDQAFPLPGTPLERVQAHFGQRPQSARQQSPSPLNQPPPVQPAPRAARWGVDVRQTRYQSPSLQPALQDPAHPPSPPGVAQFFARPVATPQPYPNFHFT